MHTSVWSLIALAAAVNAEHWIFGATRPIVTTRLDPVIMPNQASTALISFCADLEVLMGYSPDRSSRPLRGGREPIQERLRPGRPRAEQLHHDPCAARQEQLLGCKPSFACQDGARR